MKVISERLFSRVMPLVVLGIAYSVVMILPFGGRVGEFFDGPRASSRVGVVVDALTPQQFEKIKQGYGLKSGHTLVAQQILGEKARGWTWLEWGQLASVFRESGWVSTTFAMGWGCAEIRNHYLSSPVQDRYSLKINDQVVTSSVNGCKALGFNTVVLSPRAEFFDTPRL